MKRLAGWIVVAAAAAGLFWPSGASANHLPMPYGLAPDQGFFTGYNSVDNDCAANVFDNGIAYDKSTDSVSPINAEIFISIVRSYLYPTTTNTNLRLERETGAAFIVASMMGLPRNGGRADGVQFAKANFDTWASLVRSYEAGIGGASVDWGNRVRTTLPVGYPMSYYMGYCYKSTGNYYNGIHDIAFRGPNEDTAFVITFRHPDGSIYQLRRNCANPVGYLGAFPAGSFKLDADMGSPVAGTPVQPGPLLPGTNYAHQAIISSRNTSTVESGPARLEVRVTGSAASYLQPISTSAGGPLSSVSRNWDAANRRWTWNYNTINVGARSTVRFDFSFPSNTPEGQVCFQPFAFPSSGSDPGPDVGPQQCYTIQNPSYPMVTTTGSDVHAGGGVGAGCSGSGGSIRARASGPTNTLGQYLISSGTAVDYTPGTSPPRTNLTLGNVPPGMGRYKIICRPDVAQAARDYNPALRTTVGSPVNTERGDGRIAYRAGTTTVQAMTINNRWTLFVEGDVYITGNIVFGTTATSRADLPGFGLVATGNIYIAPDVTRLDGYYFAGTPTSMGEINTCSTGPGSLPFSSSANVNACRLALNVRGFMTASSFKLRRTRSNAPGVSQAEVINFLPQFYLATPPAFSDFASRSVSAPTYLGERVPLH